MKSDNLKPILPFTKTIAEVYENIFELNVHYKAFSIDEDFNIIEGIGIIRNNKSWNYHNNYDNSYNDLYFLYKNVERQQWWAIDLKEVNAVLQQEISRVKSILLQKIKDLDK